MTRGEKVSANLCSAAIWESSSHFKIHLQRSPCPKDKFPTRKTPHQSTSKLPLIKLHNRDLSLIFWNVLGKDLKGLFFRSTIRNVSAVIKTLKVISCACQGLVNSSLKDTQMVQHLSNYSWCFSGLSKPQHLWVLHEIQAGQPETRIYL